jgi:hypothetical protein
MAFDALLDRRRDVVKTHRALHQGQEVGALHGPEVDVLESAHESQVHFRFRDLLSGLQNQICKYSGHL